MRDNFDEVPKLEPRLSPAVVIELMDAAGKPLRVQIVWLIPTDPNGRAWFWCKAGPGTYTAFIRIGDRSFQTPVTPAPPGEWLAIKTVRCRLAAE